MWMISCTGSARAEDLGDFEKVSSLSWVLPSEEERWLSLARRGLGPVSHEMVGRWKSQNRKNVYLSPYVVEPLNSKVIKSFIPELRSRKCFSCFEIPMFSMYNILWTLYVHFAYPYYGYVTESLMYNISQYWNIVRYKASHKLEFDEADNAGSFRHDLEYFTWRSTPWNSESCAVCVLHLMVRPQSSCFGKWELLLHCHYSHDTLTQSGCVC